MTAHSPDLDQLFTALAAVQGEMPVVAKGSENPFFKSSYADLADTLKTAFPITSKHGLAVSQWPSHNELGQDTLVTWLGHSSGQWIRDEMILHLAKQEPQAQGSGITYGKRYSSQAALGISTDEDDDGQAANKPVRVDAFNKAEPKPRANIAPATPPRQADPDLEPMKRRIFAVSKKLGLEVEDSINCALGVDIPEDDLNFDNCRKVNDWLSEELNRETT